MKRLVLYVLILIFLDGCGLFLWTRPSSEIINNIHSIKIVSLETHPLIVPPSMAGMILPNVPIPDPSSINSIRGASVVSTVLMLIQLPQVNKYAGDVSHALEDSTFKKSHWEPTEVLATIIAELLKATALYDVSVVQGVKQMPGMTSREYSLFMWDWVLPTHRWLKGDSEIYNLKSDFRTDVVIEVTMMNYELYGDDIFMSVVTKLVDANTGKVLGRATDWETADLGGYQSAFVNDAQVFKDIFSRTGKKLLKNCLRDLGFTILE